jgi:cytochrome c-type biogenesis protein CcmH/NrfG
MQAEQFTSLLAELHAIRLALVLGVVFLGISALVIFLRASQRMTGYAERLWGDRFTADVELLFDGGKLDRVVERCRSHLESRPNHAMALWYLGRACSLQGDRRGALDAFRKLRRIQPNWARDHIDPFVAEIESETETARTDH